MLLQILSSISRKLFVKTDSNSEIKAKNCLIMGCPFNLLASALLSYWIEKCIQSQSTIKEELNEFYIDILSTLDTQNTMFCCILYRRPAHRFAVIRFLGEKNATYGVI